MSKLHNADFKNFDKRKRANFINSLSGFKGCNLIGTINSDNVENLAIISSAFHIGADPALIGLIFRPDSVPRDTLENIRNNNQCTLNHVNENIYKKAHQTSARYPKDISEFETCNLKAEYRDECKPPFVQESNIQSLLELVREVPIPENNTHLLIMKIKNVFLDESFIESDGSIDIEASGTITVSGLNNYHRTVKLEKLPYAKASSGKE